MLDICGADESSQLGAYLVISLSLCEDVHRSQITMHYIRVLQILQKRQYLYHDLKDLPRSQWRIIIQDLLSETLVILLDVLHRDVNVLIILEHIVDAEQIRMGELIVDSELLF